MNKKEAFEEINRIQDEYVDQTIELLNSPDYEMMKTINFTSPTGTGKTKMMSKLMNKLPDCFFIVTTLSKGQLHIQIRNSLKDDCMFDNYIVYGSADYRINSRLDAEDIIGRIPVGRKCIWLRDEGHINTNRWDEILLDRCDKVINFSATNKHSDILCNFTSTMMLRTVNQTNGSPEDAIKKLMEVKAAHSNISGYNPCAIFRCVGRKSDGIYDRIIASCEVNKLKYIDITDEKFDMAELCKDDNECDVIINKLKITEGIDIRRAHVLFMDNHPSSDTTTIQVIGRCRRNALLYRDDIDILASENKELLRNTRECYVFYNDDNMKIASDPNGELVYAFCNYISCQELKVGSIVEVEDGQLANGLNVIELLGYDGIFEIEVDEDTGFNIVRPWVDFYKCKTIKYNGHSAILDVDKYCWFVNSVLRHGTCGDSYKPYTKKYNDKESSIIGTDLMRQVRKQKEGCSLRKYEKPGWIESRSVSSKLQAGNTKLNRFITKRYAKELLLAKSQLFNGKNDFELDKRSNSAIGYCVEYYAKYLLYGIDYIEHLIEWDDRKYFEELYKKNHSQYPRLYSKKYLSEEYNHERQCAIVRACMNKYKVMFERSFGAYAGRYVKGISSEQLLKEKYQYFVDLVVLLGTKTAEYIRTVVYDGASDIVNNVDPDLSIAHIGGLADIITKDTILDVKVRNNIDEYCVRQVLAYHYLSTKRSDLDIKRLIIYDATSGRSVIINISEEKK